MGKRKQSDEQEQEVFYVLRRSDGSVRAELFMLPSMAEKINAGRRAKGFLDGEWKPEEAGKAVLWNLDFKLMPDWMLPLMLKAQQEGRNAKRKTRTLD